MNNEYIPKLKSDRKCEECTMCCQGWLKADIYGHTLLPGSPCHFLGKTCTIYKDRPNVCREYKCVWLEDSNYSIPEWMKPSLSNVIISRRRWGKNNEHIYWIVLECGKTMRAEILHWIINFCDVNRIDLEYQFNDQIHRRGCAEFKEYCINVLDKIKAQQGGYI
jgi:Fe-S-cluster containining protein